MNFLEAIIAKLTDNPEKTILAELRNGTLGEIRCAELLSLVDRVRETLRGIAFKAGDRCALLAPNGARWVAVDLAVMAEGGIAVPLYARQAHDELVSIMQDCAPRLIVCSDEQLKQSILAIWPSAPDCMLYSDIFDSGAEDLQGTSRLSTLSPSSPVTIIYTSGTSGDAKGVVLTAGNVGFMVERTTARLQELMVAVSPHGDDRVFHYLPFCFAGSWILLLTCLYRNNALMLSTDLSQLAEELKLASPHYMLNVPALLDRIRTGVAKQLRDHGGLPLLLFERGQAAWLRQRNREGNQLDILWLLLARWLIFPRIKQRIGRNLRALICGSAALSDETHLFFEMLGIPVLQVYGLTETTAICTMDKVDDHEVGRVGPAIPGIEMKLGGDDEILVRGPNVFQGYWNRPEATREAVIDGWFRTGDQGHVDDRGNWKIIGRLKNLIVPSSGHNISPEPIEQMLLNLLPETDQVMVVGNGRKFLSVIVTGTLAPDRVNAALQNLNNRLPHYKQVRKFHISPEPFTVENGLLTANRKVRRVAVEQFYRQQIDTLYEEIRS